MSAGDQDVVRTVRSGDREAFGLLVDRHKGRLFGLVLMMVRRPDAAADVTQDAFVRAFVHLSHYDERRPFYPWLATIAVRLSQTWLRKNSVFVLREGVTLDDTNEPGTDASSLASLISGEERRDLWSAVATLSSGERTAVTLFYRDGLATRDIAAALGVTTGTVKTLLFRARRHLRKRLGGECDAAGGHRS